MLYIINIMFCNLIHYILASIINPNLVRACDRTEKIVYILHSYTLDIYNTACMHYIYRTPLVRTLLMSNTCMVRKYKDMIPQLITHNTNLYG